MRNLCVAGTRLVAVITAILFSAAAGAAGAASYTADPQQSRLEFVGVQAGAEFKGVFHKFTATVDFAPDALAGSRIDVQIDMNSADSMDKDRDTTMRGKEIFDVAHNPTAHYVTKTITKTAAGFSAVGALTLRGVTKDVPIDFQFVPAAAGAKLTGNAKLNRLDFGVGQGDWKSTENVGDAVKINFSLVLKPKT
ncbi:MAG TPA: YceI family protein [Steroidobacteraceae bacterium]|jgi:polyisoprenoid-binding protein YceI|nr:YceI family protein [Steroidobacteraceae bacterium]